MRNTAATTAVCKQCGRPFPTHAHGRRPEYCSATCRTAAYRDRRLQMNSDRDGSPYICHNCGKTFYWKSTGTKHEHPKYCSKLCYDLAYNQREKARLKQYQHEYYLRRKAKKNARSQTAPENGTDTIQP